MDIQSITTVSLVLFSIIDSVGTLPYVIHITKQEGNINKVKVSLIAGILMLLFLFAGDKMLKLMHLDLSSFAMAGAVVMFITALEMIMGHSLQKEEQCVKGSKALVPLTFPMLAGAGTLTTLLTLRSVYETSAIVAAILVNVVIIYLVLKAANWIEKVLGCNGFSVLRKVFGIVVLAMSIKVFKTSFDLTF